MPARKMKPKTTETSGGSLAILNTKSEFVPASSLSQHPKNPRRGDIEAVRASIREHGFWGVIVVQQSTKHILVGNQRWEAAQLENIHELPVVWVDVEDDLALRIMLADNKIAEHAEWDFEQLSELLRAWSEAGIDIASLGWEEWELEPLLAANWVPPEETNEDFLPQEGRSANPDQATVVLSKEQYKLLSKVRRKMSDESPDIEDAQVIEALCSAYLKANK